MSGDPVAPAELAIEYLELLTGAIELRNPRLDPHLCATAAEDAILALIRKPESYDPQRLALDAYLRMSANGDLKNALQSESRHHSQRAPLELVDLQGVSRNSQQSPNDPALVIEEELDAAGTAAISARVMERARSSFSSEEVEVLELMLAGEGKTEAFAHALGITRMPLDAQRLEVKRTKDRLKRRLERAERGSDE